MDDTALRLYATAFVMITVVLMYTARYFHARRPRREAPGTSFKRLPGWIGRSIESRKPLHLSLGSAALDGENVAVATAEAELFHHIIESAGASDVAPLVSATAPSTVPLCHDTIRRAWQGDDRRDRVRWYPGGPRSLAWAAGVAAAHGEDEAAAHVLAGSFGPELALMLECADRRGQGTFALSDQLEGQAVAYAMADDVLIGEQLFSAAAHLSSESSARADADVQDVWRALLMALMAILLLLNGARELEIIGWQLVLPGAVALLIVMALVARRR